MSGHSDHGELDELREGDWRRVVGGVDTHADTHTAAVCDEQGRLLGHAVFPVSPAGYRALRAWLYRHGQVVAVGIEGTGSYGAGLARHLTAAGVEVVEVDRPDRAARRRRGKSDPIDAEAAARAVLSGVADGIPKTRTGPVEAIRVLRVTRRGAVKARTAAVNTLRHMILTGPEPVRAQLHGLPAKALIQACARLRPGPDLADPVQATKTALRRLATRIHDLEAEMAQAETELTALMRSHAPDLMDAVGVGPDTGAQLLITAGDNPDRLHSEASFAALCGASPVPVSSGRTDRHRLNRGGDRNANSALYTIVLVRMRYHEPTRTYVERRRAQGLSTKEIIRCLKRYTARELLPMIQKSATSSP